MVTETLRELDLEEAVLEWQETDKWEAKAQWRRGDIALALRKEYTLEELAEAVDVPYETMKVYRWVAERYEKVKRLTNLTWSHHLKVAEREDRLYWLERAANANPKKWSVARMMDEIADDDTQKLELEWERRELEEADQK
jgi:hypothetical protein